MSNRLLKRLPENMVNKPSNWQMPSLVAGSYCAQFFKCSSDRQKSMVLHAWATSVRHFESGMDTYPINPFGSAFSMTPSFISMVIGSPQSRQGEAMRIVFPGNSQLTASDSNAHWANHFCSPSTETRNCVG